MRLSETEACTSLRTTFDAFAPAPLSATPIAPPPIAIDAAPVCERIVADSVARTSSDWLVLHTPWSAFLIAARTSLSISLKASATAIEIEPPTAPNAAATEAAPVNASIVDVSRAATEMPAALTPAAPSPSIDASTWAAIRFSVVAPTPLRATPTVPPAAATEPANTWAAIVASAIARTSSNPTTLRVESLE